jgi:hypothetical protein
MQVRLFEDANALDSLRNSDFDAVSAYGEVIDNSIQAGARNIHVLFKSDAAHRENVACVVFGDDGSGMDANTLHSCLKIGWSSRYNQRGGIGRFGVGMTMAAIHECKRVEVFSKQEGGPWLRTYIDLDEVARGEMDNIPMPTPAKLPAEYEHLAGHDAGTVVIWSKYDRQSSSLNSLRRETDVWIGRTFRYFIWDGIRITVDDEEVRAIDPLYVRTENTRFPADPQARVFDDIVFNWPVDQYDAPPGSPTEAPVRIRMSLLPEEFRREQGAGGSGDAKARFIDQNEGISILRNKREVFYGPIPYWKAAGPGWPQFEDKDRWWGCEIHFDAVLDRAFTVKNIKRGADPVRQLKATIKSEILPTRGKCLEEVDRVWNAAKQQKRLERQVKVEAEGIDRPEDHLRAEQVAKVTPTDQNEIDRDKNFETEAKRYLEQARKDASDREKAAYVALFSSQPFTIMESTWKGPNFMEASHLGGRSVLEYNMSHQFFQRVYGLLDSLHDGREGDPYEVSRELKSLIDLLLIAYAKSEAKFAPDADMSAEQFIENIRMNWGQYLQSYLRTWEKEKTSGTI